MSTDVLTAAGNNAQRFEAALRISEALSACQEPEELARILAKHLSEFLTFDHLGCSGLQGEFQRNRMARVGQGPFAFPGSANRRTA